MLRWGYTEKPSGITEESMFDLDLYQSKIDETQRLNLKRKLENDPHLKYLVDAIKYAVGEIY